MVRLTVTVSLISLFVSCAPMAADGQAWAGAIQVGVGEFNAVNFAPHDHSGPVSELSIEYHSDLKVFGLIGSAIGVLANAQGGTMAYAGPYIDLAIGRSVVFTPFAGFGLYERGSGKALGTPWEFRLGLTLSYRNFGVEVAHVSNAYSGHNGRNPGDEETLVIYTYKW